MTEHVQNARLKLNDLGYFATRGLNVLAFSNWYDGLFSDAKIAGVELIHQRYARQPMATYGSARHPHNRIAFRSSSVAK